MSAGMMLYRRNYLDLDDYWRSREHHPRQRQHRDHERQDRSPCSEPGQASTALRLMDVDV